ncbi:MAG TPA: CPXCG motif-containing cysteine-rich protein [Myxococcales bacterium]|nr:CPXCG motif-containing cysteine-rich protein [Myxococcales bacterium]
MSGSVSSECPYCGEAVEVSVDEVGMSEESYVEDCPVCCRPWQVQVFRDGPEVAVQLSRDDE